MTAVTQWFARHIKPSRVGIYETRFYAFDEVVSGYSHWDGEAWSYQGETKTRARIRCEGVQEKEWRGLAEKPA